MRASDRLRSLISRPTDWRARFPELARIDAERARGGSSVRPKMSAPQPPAPPRRPELVPPSSAVSPESLALLARAPLVCSRMRRVLQSDRATTGRIVAPAPRTSCSNGSPFAPETAAAVPRHPSAPPHSLDEALRALDRFRAHQTSAEIIRASDGLRAALIATTKARARLPSWIPSSPKGRQQVSRWWRPVSLFVVLLLGGLLALTVLSESAGFRGFWGSCGLLGLALLAWGRRDRLTGLNFSDRLPVYRHVSLCKSGLLTHYQAIPHAIVRWCDSPRATRASVLRLSRSLEQLLSAASRTC